MRKRLAEAKGSCEQAMKGVLAARPVELYDTAKVSNARRVGDLIAVDIVQDGSTEPTATVYLAKEGDAWFLVVGPGDKRESRGAIVPTGPVEPLAETNADVVDAKRTLSAYIESTVMRDYAGMCSYWTAASKQILINEVGGCEKVMESYTRGLPVIVFAEAKIQNPRRRGAVIGFDVVHDTHGALAPQFLTQDAGSWLLVHLDVADRF